MKVVARRYRVDRCDCSHHAHDLAPPDLGGDPAAVPVRQQADRQDQALDRRRHVARPTDPRPIAEAGQPVGLVAGAPAKQARPAAPERAADRRDRVAVGPPAESRPPSAHDPCLGLDPSSKGTVASLISTGELHEVGKRVEPPRH
jgi:hypothetical protein